MNDKDIIRLRVLSEQCFAGVVYLEGGAALALTGGLEQQRE